MFGRGRQVGTCTPVISQFLFLEYDVFRLVADDDWRAIMDQFNWTVSMLHCDWTAVMERSDWLMASRDHL